MADGLEELARFPRFSQRLANRFERAVMLAVFSVRVLIERHKLSEEFLRLSISVGAYPKRVAKPVTWLNSHRIDELYDLGNQSMRSIRPLFLCNQIIHSYILLPVQDRKNFSHILVCSDFERNRFLYSMPVPDIVSFIRHTASDYSSRMDMTFNPARKDYDIRNYKV